MLSEKYRPKTLAEVIGRDNIIESLINFKKSKNIPNLLFIGPAGCGKTTLAQLFIKYLFKEDYKSNFLEINSSDENGIEIIRTKVKDFASKKSINSNFPRIIMLDECDRITANAQDALKKPMEAFSSTARFILCANSENIIDPIKSRCVIYRFDKLNDDVVKERLQYIIEQENTELSEKDISAITQNANGDMRQAINLLQSTISGVEIAENINNYKILSLDIKEFEDKILYKYDNKVIISKLFEELLKQKNNTKQINILAAADYRTSIQTVKTLQLLDCFMQLKGE